jgi:hypothetical protein
MQELVKTLTPEKKAVVSKKKPTVSESVEPPVQGIYFVIITEI